MMPDNADAGGARSQLELDELVSRISSSVENWRTRHAPDHGFHRDQEDSVRWNG